MHYQIRNTTENFALLDQTAYACNLLTIVMRDAPHFVVCDQCITFPSEQIGLKNALVSDCVAVRNQPCILCGDE